MNIVRNWIIELLWSLEQRIKPYCRTQIASFYQIHSTKQGLHDLIAYKTRSVYPLAVHMENIQKPNFIMNWKCMQMTPVTIREPIALEMCRIRDKTKFSEDEETV